jgi:hypothetical protein
MDFSKLCTPAYIYFVGSLIYLIINSLNNFNIINIIVNIFFIMMGAGALNFLCSKGYSIISWILIILPVAFSIYLSKIIEIKV